MQIKKSKLARVLAFEIITIVVISTIGSLLYNKFIYPHHSFIFLPGLIIPIVVAMYFNKGKMAILTSAAALVVIAFIVIGMTAVLFGFY